TRAASSSRNSSTSTSDRAPPRTRLARTIGLDLFWPVVGALPRHPCPMEVRSVELRPAKFEHGNGADPSGLAFVLGKARVAPRLLGVDAVAFSAGQLADGHLVCLGSALDGGVLAGGQVAVPVRMGGCSSLGWE